MDEIGELDPVQMNDLLRGLDYFKVLREKEFITTLRI